MILISPTAFKGTLTAREVADAMAAGVEAVVDVPTRVVPLSDGGNGLLTALESVAGGKGYGTRVAGPLGTSVTARYLVQEGRAVVETAEACGLHLVPPPLRDPSRASTRGVGELLLAAAQEAPGTIVVGLGGSATVDAGSGMVTALGWTLLDEAGIPIEPGARGLLELHAIEAPEAPPLSADLVVLADVSNPLLGSRGAAPVFGPQKGAKPEGIPVLERGLERWAGVVQRELGTDVTDLPGAGVAGGLGAAFAAFLSSPPRLGAGWLLDAADYDGLLAAADLVITGEGAWDAQSRMGKVTGEVLERAAAAGVPVLLVVGSVDGGAPEAEVITAEGGIMDADGIRARVEAALPGLLARRRGR